KSLNRDQLYGAQIKITEIKQFTDGTRKRDVYTIYFYRFVNFLAQDSESNTATFFRTLADPADGGLRRTKDVAMRLPSNIPTTFDETSTDPNNGIFELPPAAGLGTAVWSAVPTQAPK